MASVEKRGKRWRARYKNEFGELRTKTLPAATKTEAIRQARELERRCESRRLGFEPQQVRSDWTLDDAMQVWLKEHSASLPSHDTHLSAYRCHFEGTAFAQTPLAQISQGRIEQFLSEKAKELSPQSVNHLRGYLVSAFNLLIQLEHWPWQNPARAVKKRKVPQRSFDYLRAHEVGPLLNALRPCYRALFATAIYAGLRKGELFALHKSDVDLEARLLTVQRSHARSTTKALKAATIPIAEELVPYLRQAIAASPSELVFPATDEIGRAHV